MEKFLIRKATPDDAYGITYVNVYTWKTTYQWLIPNFLIENRIKNINERIEKMREIIKENWMHLVVEDTETRKIVWVLSYCPSRNQDYPNLWEIMAIYILKEYQKLWLGKKLFFAWINELIKLWYNDMILNVLKWNDTINFYKKYGGVVVWERFDEIGEKKIKIYEDIIYFKDIESLYLTYNSKD